jgi:Family of unknown function (DUF6055)
VRRVLPAVLLLAAAAALPAPSQATGGDLAVRSVSTARSVTAGSPVFVQVRVVRTGRTPGVKARFYLSADGTRDGRDVPLSGAVRIGAGGPARALRVTARPQVPTGQALGAYHLIACVDDPGRVRERNERNNCRAAKGRVNITATPVGTRELVGAAVAAHRLTPQQGLVYRVFDAFGDRRLPAAYAGDDAATEDTVMRDVIDAWPTLSSVQRRELQPFFTPPPATGKGVARTRGASSIKPEPLVQPECGTARVPTGDWRTAAKPGGHVRIWWPRSDEREVGAQARHLVSEVENVRWPKLRAVMGREPLSDAHEPCYHGIDGKLDIYLGRLDRGRAVTIPYPPDCKATPAYIVFDSPAAPHPWELAHELMHAFQFSFRYRDACSSYSNWDEGTANWAGQHVYPNDDGEHAFSWLLEEPEESLAEAWYGGWVFAYAMEQLHGAGTIGAIYRQTESRGVLQAIDAGVPGGLRQAWPEFSRLAWNQDPVSPTFRNWDRLTDVPLRNRVPIGIEQIDPGFSGQNEVAVPLGLSALTRSYRHFKFGLGVTQVTVSKPRDPDLHVEALLKLRNGTTRTEDWSGRGPIVFCPQSPGERLDEAVLVVSNTSLTRQLPADRPMKVVGTNLGCSRYVGTVSGTERVHTASIDTTESWSATGVTFERAPSGQDSPNLIFNLTGGSVTRSFTGPMAVARTGPARSRLPFWATAA